MDQAHTPRHSVQGAVSSVPYPMVSVTAITDNVESLTEKFPNMFFTLGNTSSFVSGVIEVLDDMRAVGTIGNRVAMVNVADAFGIELADAARLMLEVPCQTRKPKPPSP